MTAPASTLITMKPPLSTLSTHAKHAHSTSVSMKLSKSDLNSSTYSPTFNGTPLHTGTSSQPASSMTVKSAVLFLTTTSLSTANMSNTAKFSPRFPPTPHPKPYRQSRPRMLAHLSNTSTKAIFTPSACCCLKLALLNLPMN